MLLHTSQSKTYGLCTHIVKLYKNIPQTSRSQICLALLLLITFVVKAQKLETRKGSLNTGTVFCYCCIFPSLFQQYCSWKYLLTDTRTIKKTSFSPTPGW